MSDLIPWTWLMGVDLAGWDEGGRRGEATQLAAAAMNVSACLSLVFVCPSTSEERPCLRSVCKCPGKNCSQKID
jgi:hypothetical protein